jgi:hypothetical protein
VTEKLTPEQLRAMVDSLTAHNLEQRNFRMKVVFPNAAGVKREEIERNITERDEKRKA